jgi:Domain of unknown function (DUF1996)
MHHLRMSLRHGRRRALVCAAGAIMLLALVTVDQAHARAEGFFSIRCRSSHAATDDPIVAPGVPGSTHLHQFFGSTSTDAHSAYRTMVESSSSCRLSKDTAGYWAPALVSPSGEVVRTISQIAYYRAMGDDPVQAFPADLRMIAGYPTLRTGIEHYLGWGCSDGQWLDEPGDCTGKGNVKASVTFPSCWNGFQLDSADHRAHMTYRVGKRCPDSHPVALPTLKIHITFDVSDARGYMLSSDMMLGTAGGHSLHADFWNTWDQDALEGLVRGCLLTGRNCASTTTSNFSERVA